ncbi:carboxymuconolactone decarboxylase family protein [Nonomuraea sp. B5E05]|uniref:carboxymuconolactone decarboxylase family protein n=1 Tax=Nonomuraea sp. B5E05 TaxID=3153569 RepID=UPI00326125AA
MIVDAGLAELTVAIACVDAGAEVTSHQAHGTLGGGAVRPLGRTSPRMRTSVLSSIPWPSSSTYPSNKGDLSMKLASQNAITSLDPDFGDMAVKRGRFAWGLQQLTMREKAFVFIAADLCCHNLQFPLQTHVTMALSNGVALEDMREAVRHLAPYVGYPTAAEALMRLVEIEKSIETISPPTGTAVETNVELPPQVLTEAKALDEEFAAFLEEQFGERWGRANLTVAERALCTIATDVLNGTLGHSFQMHAGLALDHGATEDQLRAVLLLIAEFGIARAGRGFEALRDFLATRH